MLHSRAITAAVAIVAIWTLVGGVYWHNRSSEEPPPPERTVAIEPESPAPPPDAVDPVDAPPAAEPTPPPPDEQAAPAPPEPKEKPAVAEDAPGGETSLETEITEAPEEAELEAVVPETTEGPQEVAPEPAKPETEITEAPAEAESDPAAPDTETTEAPAEPEPEPAAPDTETTEAPAEAEPETAEAPAEPKLQPVAPETTEAPQEAAPAPAVPETETAKAPPEEPAEPKAAEADQSADAPWYTLRTPAAETDAAEEAAEIEPGSAGEAPWYRSPSAGETPFAAAQPTEPAAEPDSSELQVEKAPAEKPAETEAEATRESVAPDEAAAPPQIEPETEASTPQEPEQAAPEEQIVKAPAQEQPKPGPSEADQAADAPWYTLRSPSKEGDAARSELAAEPEVSGEAPWYRLPQPGETPLSAAPPDIEADPAAPETNIAETTPEQSPAVETPEPPAQEPAAPDEPAPEAQAARAPPQEPAGPAPAETDDAAEDRYWWTLDRPSDRTAEPEEEQAAAELEAAGAAPWYRLPQQGETPFAAATPDSEAERAAPETDTAETTPEPSPAVQTPEPAAQEPAAPEEPTPDSEVARAPPQEPVGPAPAETDDAAGDRYWWTLDRPSDRTAEPEEERAAVEPGSAGQAPWYRLPGPGETPFVLPQEEEPAAAEPAQPEADAAKAKPQEKAEEAKQEPATADEPADSTPWWRLPSSPKTGDKSEPDRTEADPAAGGEAPWWRLPQPGETPPADNASKDDAAAKTPPQKQAASEPREEAAPEQRKGARIPSFDVVRVERSGEGVAAGQAEPGWTIELRAGDRAVGTARVDDVGEWALVISEPLPPGDHALKLRATSPDGERAITSDQTVMVAIAGAASEETVVALNEPGEPTRILQRQEGVAKKPARMPEPKASDPKTVTQQEQSPTEGEEEGEGKDLAAAQPEDAEPNDEAIRGGRIRAREAGEERDDRQPEAEVAEPRSPVAFGAASYEESESGAGSVYISGTAAPGAVLNIYIDNDPVGSVRADANGRWTFQKPQNLETGAHLMRVDEVDVYDTVVSRAEVSIEHLEPPRQVAEVKPEAAAPAAAAVEDEPAETAQGSVDDSAEAEVAAAEPKQSAAPAPGARRQQARRSATRRVHVVRRGDTLWDIAEVVYGGGWRYTIIFRNNRDQIRDPHWIYPKQRFRLPRRR